MRRCKHSLCLFLIFFPARAFAWAHLSQKVKSWRMPVRSSLPSDWIRCAIPLWATKCRVAFRVVSGSDLTSVSNWLPLHCCFFWMNRRVALILAQLWSCVRSVLAVQPAVASLMHRRQVLKTLAQLQLTIVAVVHQPRWEIFRLFDDLTLLTSSGNVAYSGATQVAHHPSRPALAKSCFCCSFACLSSKKWD